MRFVTSTWVNVTRHGPFTNGGPSRRPGLDSAGARPLRSAHVAGAADLRQHGAGVGGRGARGARSPCSRRRRLPAWTHRLRSPSPSATFYAPTTGRCAGEPPAFDTPAEDVYLTGRNVILLSNGGHLLRAAAHRRLALGPPRGQPVPDATSRSSYCAWRARCRSGSRTTSWWTPPFARMHRTP
jgi:hypothetical protein